MLNDTNTIYVEALTKQMHTAAKVSAEFLDQYLKNGNQHLNALRQSFEIIIKNSEAVLELINKSKNS
jgi:hypothetical protein